MARRVQPARRREDVRTQPNRGGAGGEYPGAQKPPKAPQRTRESVDRGFRGPRTSTASRGNQRSERAAQSAQARAVLDQYGLSELAPLVDRWIRDGMSWDEVWLDLMDPSTDAGEVVDRIYPEIRLRREANQAPVTIGEILSYRSTATQVFREAGIPEGFYDSPEDFRSFIVNDISLAELKTRVDDGFRAAQAAPSEVRDELTRIYGISDGGLAAYWIDPNRALPLLLRQFEAAKVGGSAVRTGYGVLSQSEAERVASLGVDAEAGFGALAAGAELFSPINAGEDEITRAEQFGAVFEGNEAARRRIAKRQAERIAPFRQGGGFSSDREGFSGLGTAS